MKAWSLSLLLAVAGALIPLAGWAAASPFGPTPPVVRIGPPQTPTDPNRWLPWRLFTWRDGVKPGNPALAQDGQGYIWADGPVRYNGRSWQQMEVPGEGGPVPCWSLLAASDGSLWFGRLEGGLLRFVNGAWTRIAPGSGLPAGLVGALVEGSPGTVWAGTTTGLASCRGGRCEEEKALRGTNVRSLAATRTETGRPALWIGTSHGLLRLDGIDGPAPTLSSRFEDPAALPDLSIRGLAETVSPEGERALWVATDNGVACLRKGAWTRYDARSGFPAGPVVKLAASRSPEGRPVVWAGSFRVGLFRFEEDGRWKLFDTRSGLPANVIYNLLLTPNEEGREPTLWAATPAGLARLELEHWTTLDSRAGLPNDIVIGGGEVTFPDGLRTYWIGTVGGMVRLTPRGWERYATPVTSESDLVFNTLAAPDDDGAPAFWMGTVNGLRRFARGAWTSFTTRNSPLPYDWVTTLLAVPGSRGTALWIGTNQGLARYEHGSWTVFRAGELRPAGRAGAGIDAHVPAGREPDPLDRHRARPGPFPGKRLGEGRRTLPSQSRGPLAALPGRSRGGLALDRHPERRDPSPPRRAGAPAGGVPDAHRRDPTGPPPGRGEPHRDRRLGAPLPVHRLGGAPPHGGARPRPRHRPGGVVRRRGTACRE